MTIKFSSKEIHFLRSDSDDANFNPPERYFSDLLLDRTEPVKNFEERLLKTDIPQDNFLCAALHLTQDQTEDIPENVNDAFEATFNAFLDKERGIWESLDETSFVLAFWDYNSEEKAFDLLVSLKEKLATTLKADILAGVCFFPFHNFSKPQTFSNALKAIDHAAFFGPNTHHRFDATSLNICADRLYQLGQYKNAIIEYETGLEIEPRNANLMNSLGVCFGISGQLDKAKEQFKNAAIAAPKEPMVIYNIGLLQNIDDQPDKAVIYLRKAHGVDPNVFEVELLLGQILHKKGSDDQALPYLEKAAQLNPQSALAFRLLGEIYLDKALFQKAAQQFNTAIKLNPADAISLSGYAQSWSLQEKNLKIALSFATNSVALDPDNPLFRGRLKEIQGKIDLLQPKKDNIKTA